MPVLLPLQVANPVQAEHNLLPPITTIRSTAKNDNYNTDKYGSDSGYDADDADDGDDRLCWQRHGHCCW